MNKVITVKGSGTVSSKPDTIFLTMAIETRHAEYSKCMKVAAKELESLRQAFTKLGFAADALKSTDFRIDAEYKHLKDTTGNYHDVFDVWTCSHALKLEFPMDCGQLVKTLSAIGKCNTRPKFRIRFGVADSGAICEELLKSATKNARRKAEILCAAGGVKLGELVSIDYDWGDLSVYSPTLFEDDYAAARVCCDVAAPVRLDPEEVKNSDTVTFVWSIA